MGSSKSKSQCDVTAITLFELRQIYKKLRYMEYGQVVDFLNSKCIQTNFALTVNEPRILMADEFNQQSTTFLLKMKMQYPLSYYCQFDLGTHSSVRERQEEAELILTAEQSDFLLRNGYASRESDSSDSGSGDKLQFSHLKCHIF